MFIFPTDWVKESRQFREMFAELSQGKDVLPDKSDDCIWIEFDVMGKPVGVEQFEVRVFGFIDFLEIIFLSPFSVVGAKLDPVRVYLQPKAPDMERIREIEDSCTEDIIFSQMAKFDIMRSKLFLESYIFTN